MKLRGTLTVFMLVLGFSINCQALPILQIGAPGGPGAAETAGIEGGTLYVAGVYRKDVVHLGGGSGDEDWSKFGMPNAPGALLLAAVPEGTMDQALASLRVNGESAVYHTATGIGAIFGNSHDPLKDAVSDFLFFNIGNFAKIPGAVTDFASSMETADGEVKTLILSGMNALPWIHFDVMALETKLKNNPIKRSLKTDLITSSNSHDAAWKPVPVPEPSICLLLGAGLLGLLAFRPRNRKTNGA